MPHHLEPAPRSPGWRLQLLGGCRLLAPDGGERTPVGRKTRGLLAALALAGGAPVGRERLADLLWSERAAEQARGSLRQSLKELRRCLGDPTLVPADHDRVALDVARVEVDALRLEALAAGEAPLATIVGLAQGELLEGLGGLGPAFDEWLARQRQRGRALVLEALEQRLERATDPAELLTLTGRLLELEPAHEPAHRARMLLHAKRGDTAAAIRQFEACREELARRLDAHPSAPTLALLARIRAGGAVEPVTVAPAEPAGASPLVVLPLREQGGPRDLPPLGEGLAEEISAALARFRWLFVLAPSSAAVLARELAEPLAIARRLGARYLVDGRISHEPDGLRVRVELIDATVGRLLWSEHETLPAGRLAELPRELAAAIAARLARELMLHESARAPQASEERADAHQLVLRAARLVYTLDMPELARASELLRRAVARDPGHALGHAWLGTTLVLRAGYPWRAGHATLIAEADATLARAIALDPAEAIALATRAQCRVLERDLEQARQLSERALAANPGLPMAWGRAALVACYLGEPEAALRHLARYRRLSPFDPFQPLFGRGEVFAHLLAGRYAAAVEAARPLIVRKPTLFGCYLPMLAALGHLGRRAEAEACLADIYRIEPRFSLETFLASYPLRDPRDLDRYASGLRRAGLRERAPEPALAPRAGA